MLRTGLWNCKAKLYKLSVNGKTDDLPRRPTVSSVNIATYQLKQLKKNYCGILENQNITSKVQKSLFSK